MKKIAVVFLMMGMGSFLFAHKQETNPVKYVNSTWYEVVYVDFKTEKVEEAKRIMEKYQSSAQTSGSTMPEQYWLENGSYDMMLVWELEDGSSDVEWKWSENGIKWWKAFIKQEGSVDAADKVQVEYDSYVADSKREIVRIDK